MDVKRGEPMKSAPALTHQTLGRYQLLVPVARGGMGQVWLARLQGARGFNKLVAIKTLLADEQDRSRLESMLAEEARIASLIQHANVVHTMELGEHRGLLYLVMEWVDGEPLGLVLERAAQSGGVPFGVAAALTSQVLAGLHAAHELSDESGPLGVVHRDVSPHNILVTYDGVAKLLDFGIAKATQQAASNTVTGEVKGKFSYMSPEQILDGKVDRRCDVFATGIVLYMLSTGRHPFKHHNTAAVIHSITTDAPVTPPSALVEDFPSELERVLLKALEKDANNRWPSAADMRRALERAVPEGFDDTARSELRAFMERTVGDRKLARREAVRRAQLAADGIDHETGSRRALQTGSAQSVSSLRAISISQPPIDALQPDSRPEESSNTRAAPVPSRRRPGAGWVFATVSLALALAGGLPPLLYPARPPRAAAPSIDTGSGSSAVEAARAPTPLSIGPKAPLEPSSARPAPATLPSSVASAAPAPASTPATQVGRPGQAKKPVRRSRPHGGAANDLLSPDYAF